MIVLGWNACPVCTACPVEREAYSSGVGRHYRTGACTTCPVKINIALERIADRVRRGGHNVPEDIVRRRFDKGLPNLFQLYRPLLNSRVIFDNSSDTPNMIAFEKLGQLQIVASDLFAKLSRSLEVL